MHYDRFCKIVDDIQLLKEEIKVQEIKQNFMGESILIDTSESIKLLKANIEEALE